MKISKLFIPVRPVPASRPRVSRYGTYYTKNYSTFLRDASAFLRTIKKYPAKDNKIFTVVVEFICYKPKQPSNNYPRGDVDNFLKGPMDTLTKMKKFWDDDVQVIMAVGFKRYQDEGEDYGIKVHVFEYPDTKEGYKEIRKKFCGLL